MLKHPINTHNILTKHRMAKINRGMVERPSSQRQPRVGITRIAKRTSNTVPSAQNICKATALKISCLNKIDFVSKLYTFLLANTCLAFHCCVVMVAVFHKL